MLGQGGGPGGSRERGGWGGVGKGFASHGLIDLKANILFFGEVGHMGNRKQPLTMASLRK